MDNTRDVLNFDEIIQNLEKEKNKKISGIGLVSSEAKEKIIQAINADFENRMEEISKIPGYNARMIGKLGHKTRIAYEEHKNKKKEVVEDCSYSKSTKKKYIASIGENFVNTWENFSNEPGFKKALEQAREEGLMRHKAINAERAYEKALDSYFSVSSGGRVWDLIEKIDGENEKKQQLLKWVSELEKRPEDEVKKILIDSNVESMGVTEDSIKNMSVEDIMKELREEIDIYIEDEIKNIKNGYSEEEVADAERKLSLEDKWRKAREKYEKARKEYENSQMAYRGKVIEIRKEELFGHKEKILECLKNRVNREPAEVEGYKGEYVYITLPKVGNFKGFRFKYFISNKKLMWRNFIENPKLQEKSHSIYSFQELLGKIREYMKERGVRIDEVGDCLEYITGLNDFCKLKDGFARIGDRYGASIEIEVVMIFVLEIDIIYF